MRFDLHRASSGNQLEHQLIEPKCLILGNPVKDVPVHAVHTQSRDRRSAASPEADEVTSLTGNQNSVVDELLPMGRRDGEEPVLGLVSLHERTKVKIAKNVSVHDDKVLGEFGHKT